MPEYHEIRALYDRETITVYQAYRPEIAESALEAGHFVPPWSTNRMTWIKPSFLWMMERCGWATKPGQERVLAVRLHRWGFDKALSLAVLTHAEGDAEAWRRELESSPVRQRGGDPPHAPPLSRGPIHVRVQWDPERSLGGGKLEHRSLQVGLGRQLAEEFNRSWLVSLSDVTPLARKIRSLRDQGETEAARRLLPQEAVYPVAPEVRRRLRMPEGR